MPTGRISEGAERVRTERVLAIARAFLTVSGLIAIYLDPTEPRRFQEITYAILMAYAAYAIVVMFAVYAASRLDRSHIAAIHAIDILCASLLTIVSAGPVSPFFLFFLFAVLAAAFRWASKETLMTAAVVVVVYLAEMTVALTGPMRDLFETGEGDLNRILLPAAYLMIAGVLLSYLAEQDKRARRELATIADAARQPRIASSLNESVTSLARNLLPAFGADVVVVALKDLETERAMLWLVKPGEVANASPADDSPIELDLDQEAAWLFDDAGTAWHASLTEDRHAAVRVSVPGNWPLEKREMPIPGQLKAVKCPASLLAINFGLADEWKGRAYVFAPTRTLGAERALHLLESMIDYVTPSITNVFLLRRLRQRAGADERARVARELHDGAIQALFGLDMKIEALRRANNRTEESVDATLQEVQAAVRHEVLELRDLMQALRPVEIEGSQQLQEVVSNVVERFRRDTGISARFVPSGRGLNLPPATALEMVRIIQEALVNVRKHSGGQNVLVRIESIESDACRLTIEDDGRGFEFEGRVNDSEMARQRIGPAIIRERARIANAGLVVESVKGQGARLELTFGGAAS